ncbi:MAG: [FeFe] hydrogenase H-cluster maturation GTPase HydF [Candidatus Raymondbacteria bacterium RifOxyB12_full_50_8]|uniref:[FeFe] hydrogenase H-cluster maturation GTPase HydF n=1 Tax=Candidatus Raymondbacteria bacterium RIFOXYD12_FULL_49_13 TaxID=1817890 RepID=A0A1F7F9H9_UNCRA|nr:MAG: [FeFe] hydrogenase H-cluster maturation GTPase HydF [Candidatus Raymondbacteria bacterium RifOxyB12_full_50_8]OGJ93237.1 MAG: [FeFe] hydrogenase H-cluster maturation GTPase HydF [Candidatus Raymondbacteria bacterium RIFOXYA2_FULL_49_16]OGK03320.1 MAG: [FeFe] hydrogenase H-cluster maturation GTPase HydF [Candidatus Raymondbacteria bacterium RIFOXYD12_FULL_49_13]OGP44959.1 MAG: [FeFe] hydrogenase H-cluster maturation GTPase HydF [Candidatus Raymondbacteria bacterium RIFOXYB2_FULL_49_35]
MNTTPKSLRLHIGIFGRTNVGKSSFLNMVAGQDVAITSPLPGTTTDVVEKPMELLPIGPVVFLDTGGINDVTVLADQRIKKTAGIFDRSEIVVLVTTPGIWTEHEDHIAQEAQKRKLPVLVAVNKIDMESPAQAWVDKIKDVSPHIVLCSSVDEENNERYRTLVREALISLCPQEFLHPLPLIGDLLLPGGVVVLIVPIDLQAPAGRLILPQVQTIRDALDADAMALVVKEREYTQALASLKQKPSLVVCDSQVVMKMVADTPADVPCTTFSTLFMRYKGDLVQAVRAAALIDTLVPGDKVLIAESCSHHPLQDDIGRVKIPRWLRQYTGKDLVIDTCAGRDFPDNLKTYKLVIHCGACMLTRREMLARIARTTEAGVPMTNYGVAISLLQGVLPRVLSPFPAALDALKREKKKG